MPGFEYVHELNPFHPYYLKNIENYKVLRFMDMGHTNNNLQMNWTNRVLPTTDTQTRGVAIEHLIDLANIVGADPWFNIPHMATDEYVTEFAKLVKANLRKDVQVALLYLFDDTL